MSYAPLPESLPTCSCPMLTVIPSTDDPNVITIDLDRATIPWWLDGLRLVVSRIDSRPRDPLSPTSIHGATMLAMNYMYNQAKYPFGYVPPMTVNYPEYNDEAKVTSFNMNGHGGKRLRLTWGMALYATRALGEWLLTDWKCEATARVYEKVGSSRYTYRGCVGFVEVQPFQGEHSGSVRMPAAMGGGMGETSRSWAYDEVYMCCGKKEIRQNFSINSIFTTRKE